MLQCPPVLPEDAGVPEGVGGMLEAGILESGGFATGVFEAGVSEAGIPEEVSLETRTAAEGEAAGGGDTAGTLLDGVDEVPPVKMSF